MARFADSFAYADSRFSASAQPRREAYASLLDSSRTLAGMLLAAAMAALLVVADQVIDTWADGHLLAGWVALWTVAFAALAFLASPLRRVAALAARYFQSQLSEWRAERLEARMWEVARHDPRIMEEIMAAMGRQV